MNPLIMRHFKLFLKIVAIITIFISSPSCNHIQNGKDLSKTEIEYIKGLGLLDSNETILLFETHSGKRIDGYKTSGNFISDKRLASYWINENKPEKTNINFSYYNDIDTLTTTDLSDDWSLASYQSVRKKDGTSFKLNISGNKTEVIDFFNASIKEWTKHKKLNNNSD